MQESRQRVKDVVTMFKGSCGFRGMNGTSSEVREYRTELKAHFVGTPEEPIKPKPSKWRMLQVVCPQVVLALVLLTLGVVFSTDGDKARLAVIVALGVGNVVWLVKGCTQYIAAFRRSHSKERDSCQISENVA